MHMQGIDRTSPDRILERKLQKMLPSQIDKLNSLCRRINDECRKILCFVDGREKSSEDESLQMQESIEIVRERVQSVLEMVSKGGEPSTLLQRIVSLLDPLVSIHVQATEASAAIDANSAAMREAVSKLERMYTALQRERARLDKMQSLPEDIASAKGTVCRSDRVTLQRTAVQAAEDHHTEATERLDKLTSVPALQLSVVSGSSSKTLQSVVYSMRQLAERIDPSSVRIESAREYFAGLFHEACVEVESRKNEEERRQQLEFTSTLLKKLEHSVEYQLAFFKRVLLATHDEARKMHPGGIGQEEHIALLRGNFRRMKNADFTYNQTMWNELYKLLEIINDTPSGRVMNAVKDIEQELQEKMKRYLAEISRSQSLVIDASTNVVNSIDGGELPIQLLPGSGFSLHQRRNSKRIIHANRKRLDQDMGREKIRLMLYNLSVIRRAVRLSYYIDIIKTTFFSRLKWLVGKCKRS